MGHEAVAYVSGISFHGLKAEYPWDGIRQILHMASKGYLEKPVEIDVKWAIFIEHFLHVEHGCNIYIAIILNNLTKSPCKLVILILFSQLKKICFDESSNWGMNMVAHYKLCFYKLS